MPPAFRPADFAERSSTKIVVFPSAVLGTALAVHNPNMQRNP
jgi:hypothetical protein